MSSPFDYIHPYPCSDTRTGSARTFEGEPQRMFEEERYGFGLTEWCCFADKFERTMALDALNRVRSYTKVKVTW